MVELAQLVEADKVYLICLPFVEVEFHELGITSCLAYKPGILFLSNIWN
ncbi:hypothetical protein C5167_033057 [Papaver somniferum]|uniref:Uncharacterized protein n=1 Tax=Papaver somniferum TaxID=3469 RepID=A0A4Y7KAN1_PAPSO|nr:hypothetical protein C5167_033057 [Papaver somniferum]